MRLYDNKIIITWQIYFACDSYFKANCHTKMVNAVLAHNELKHIFKVMSSYYGGVFSANKINPNFNNALRATCGRN